MNKYSLVAKIEKIAPLHTQEAWDCSGWIVDNPEVVDVNKIMLALTVTDKVYELAKSKNCDMIIAHHPLFEVPIRYRDMQIYSSHTPMDKAENGTTETLIKRLGFVNFKIENEFVRVVEQKISVSELKNKLKQISPNLRLINNNGTKTVSKIGFCAGSGSEFIDCGDYDCFVTGDVKYHTAVETEKVVFDIGHFESEILILDRFKEILGIDVVMSDEKSPFI